MKDLIAFLLLVGWIAGIALAHGFFSTLFALCVPLWAWYLCVERLVLP